MEGSTVAADGSEVRFNHGLAAEGGQPDVGATVTALRRAIGHASSGEDAERFDGLFTRIVRARQYTEGHHPVRVNLTDDDVNHIRLAHLIAADSLSPGDEEIRSTFNDNRKRF